MFSAHLIGLRFARLNGDSLRKHERGSFAVMAAVWMLVAIAALGTIDIGNMFFVRRDLQRIADMSAIAGVEQIDDACDQQPMQAAINNAVANGLKQSTGDTVVPVCGSWDPTNNPEPSYFVAMAAGMSQPTQLNAMEVTVTRTVPFFFLGPTRVVSAQSIAKATTVDTFSVSATLASVNPTWLNGMLSALLGTSVNLTLVDYQALASTNIKLGDLAAAVGAGSVNGLTTTSVGVSTLIGDLQTYVGTVQSGTNNSPGYIAQLQSVLPSLGKIPSVGVTNASVVLANQTNSLLQIGLGNPQSAANATVNLLDLLMTAAEVGNVAHAVTLSGSLPLGTSTATNIQLQILNPPSIAVGEAGKLPNGTWRTQASSAEIGLYLNVQTPPVAVSIPGLLGAQLNGISLPLYLIAGGPASAWLVSTDCQSSAATSTITIGAQPGIARLCVSAPPSGTLNLSDPNSCPSASSALQIASLSATLLNIPLVSVPVTAAVANPLLQVVGSPASSTDSSPPQFCGDPANYPAPAVCPNGWSSNPYWTTYSNNLGSQLATAVSQLNLQSLNLSVSAFGVTLATLTVPVGTLSSILSGILSPILSSLDSLIVPLLNVLGVQVGEATVHQMSLTCGVAETVYSQPLN